MATVTIQASDQPYLDGYTHVYVQNKYSETRVHERRFELHQSEFLTLTIYDGQRVIVEEKPIDQEPEVKGFVPQAGKVVGSDVWPPKSYPATYVTERERDRGD